MHVLIKKLRSKDGEFVIEEEGISVEEIRSFRTYKLKDSERKSLREAGLDIDKDNDITLLYMQPKEPGKAPIEIKVGETLHDFAVRIGAIGDKVVTVAGE